MLKLQAALGGASVWIPNDTKKWRAAGQGRSRSGTGLGAASNGLDGEWRPGKPRLQIAIAGRTDMTVIYERCSHKRVRHHLYWAP